MNEQGYFNLVNGIYKQAAIDYVRALLSNNDGEIKALENFLTSGAYGYDVERGKYVADKCREEINCAQNFIDEFFSKGLKKIKINEREVVISILRTVVRFRYHKRLKVREGERSNIFYLIRA